MKMSINLFSIKFLFRDRRQVEAAILIFWLYKYELNSDT